MPSEAFFHLEEKKKEALFRAAISEFSSLPYDKVSIFKIAQNAGVSRSSFYYYFKSKEDIYQYLLKQIKMEFIEKLEQEKKQYDLFEFCRKIFYFVAELKGTEEEAFFRQVIFDMKPEDLHDFFDRIEACAEENHFNYLCGLDKYKVSSVQELQVLTFLISCSTLLSLKSYLADKVSLDKAIKTLDKMYEMIKYGVAK